MDIPATIEAVTDKIDDLAVAQKLESCISLISRIARTAYAAFARVKTETTVPTRAPELAPAR